MTSKAIAERKPKRGASASRTARGAKQSAATPAAPRKTQARKGSKTPSRSKSNGEPKKPRRRLVKGSLEEKSGRAYGGLSALERQRERAARLLESGYELFATEGYANVSIERVCSHAGVTARHFYEAFPHEKIS